MSVFDIVIIALLGLSAILGFRKGFVKQLFGLLAVILGVYCAFKFSGLLSSLIAKWLDIDKVALWVIAFLVTMILVWVGIIFLGRLLDTLIKLAALGFINRLLGLVFAALQTLFILSVMVYAFSYLEIAKDKEVNDELTKSKAYEPMKRLAEAAFPYLKF